jgi:hypothetical protein
MMQRRAARFDNGGMQLHKTKLQFQSEREDRIPEGFTLEEHSASHWMIEELMLMSNKVVATYLNNSPLHDVAVLRNHAKPDAKKAEKITDQLDFLGCPIDYSTASSLHESIAAVHQKYGTAVGQAIEFLIMTNGMQQAEYICLGDDVNPHHFALNFLYYTHFTSPIRRYADVMVHRVLYDATLVEKGQMSLEDALAIYDKEEVSGQCECCNEKKKQARIAQMDCDRAFFCMFLRERDEWFYDKGTIVKMTETYIEVYVDLLGKQGRVEFFTEAEHELLEAYEAAAPRRSDDEEEGSAPKKNKVKDFIHWPKGWESLSSDRIRVTWRKFGSADINPDGSMRETTKRKELELFGNADVAVLPLNTVPISFGIVLASPFRSGPAKEKDARPPYEGNQGSRTLVVDQEAAARIVKHHTTIMPPDARYVQS